MRTTKLLGPAALVGALMLVAASPAMAGNAMTASITADVDGIFLDQFFPEMVEERCPPGSPQGIVRSSGSGTLTSEVYTGDVAITDEHCTLLLAARSDGELAVAYIRAAVLELEALDPPGGTLTIAYSAPGVIKGDLFAGPNVHTLNGPYTITEGTGGFAGATGHGHVSGSAEFTGVAYNISITLNGSLALRSA